MYPNERRVIDDFLAQKRIAVVGVSRQTRDFTRILFRTFLDKGYDAVPVNPQASELEGRACYGRVGDIPGGVDGALVMTPPPANHAVVEECIAAKVPRIWLYRAVVNGAVSEDVVEMCDQAGVPVVAGECPMMFLPRTGFPHNVHGYVRKLMGTYPK